MANNEIFSTVKYFINGKEQEENTMFLEKEFNSLKQTIFNEFNITNDLNEFIIFYYVKNPNEKIIITNNDELTNILKENNNDALIYLECHNNKEKILKEREEIKKKILEKKKKQKKIMNKIIISILKK